VPADEGESNGEDDETVVAEGLEGAGMDQVGKAGSAVMKVPRRSRGAATRR
jgi:hypothetical protein